MNLAHAALPQHVFQAGQAERQGLSGRAQAWIKESGRIAVADVPCLLQRLHECLRGMVRAGIVCIEKVWMGNPDRAKPLPEPQAALHDPAVGRQRPLALFQREEQQFGEWVRAND
ncbi:hypothetical protein WR25_25681 [Diploscapter pachys]|uniref:Uncharacterized protein n=1 Tax=Diploscapter pachys TaxID=2018661 RepID=A0A2A2K6M9_9BILA|nr:hypothetical protein WR25_25681 [Diploscapter pachys]